MTSAAVAEPGGSGALLIAIHDHLRRELAGLQHAGAALAAGALPVGEVREQVRDSQLRRTFTRFGAFCAMYCQVVHGHHGIEDAHMYPALTAADPSLREVVDDLTQEHVRIAGLLRALDDALVRTRQDDRGLADDVQAVVVALHQLADALLVHLRVEEELLVPALDRLRLRI